MKGLSYTQNKTFVTMRNGWTARKFAFYDSSVSCPQCGAHPGYRCIAKSGNVRLDGFHMPRRRLAAQYLLTLTNVPPDPPEKWKIRSPTHPQIAAWMPTPTPVVAFPSQAHPTVTAVGAWAARLVEMEIDMRVHGQKLNGTGDATVQVLDHLQCEVSQLRRRVEGIINALAKDRLL